jgi:hypothetical protein
MKRSTLLLFFSAVVSFVAPALARADELLLTFTGFDYEDPNPVPATFLEVGEGYKVVGFITTYGPLLTPYTDFSAEEYTFHLFGLTVATRQTLGNLLAVTMNNGGRGRYYYDDLAPPDGVGTHGDYGSNPPNLTSPSTFIDGVLGLGGSVDNFNLSYNFNTNQGNFQANMTLDEGPYLTYIPPAQRAGWVLAGLAGRPNPTVPAGYVDQLSGECRIPDVTTTTHGTWGAVKALYR